jgi:hypothetical protein
MGKKADSPSNRTTHSLLKDLMGCSIVKAFAGSMIEFFDRHCNKKFGVTSLKQTF